MTIGIAALLALALSASAGQRQATASVDPCAWTPPMSKAVRQVKTADDLARAVSTAAPDTTILLGDGDYRLRQMLDIRSPRVVIRGASSDRSKVVLHGDAMTEGQVGVALSISAADVTIADLTVARVGFHGVQVRGESGASRVRIHRVRIADTGQQLIKGSYDGGSQHSDEGVVSCSLLEYTDHAPSDYTNAIDIIGGNGWTVHDNVIRRIHGPADRGWAAGPAILFWGNSRDTVVERNLILDSFRGIALGLGPGASGRLARDKEPRLDHQGGVVRDNVIVNLNRWADEAIEANAASHVTIDNNTVLTAGVPWSISFRFRETSGAARQNLTSQPVILRDGGAGTRADNVESATSSWFVDAATGDLRLSPQGIAALGSRSVGAASRRTTAR